jgi:hypothetical protein
MHHEMAAAIAAPNEANTGNVVTAMVAPDAMAIAARIRANDECS